MVSRLSVASIIVCLFTTTMAQPIHVQGLIDPDNVAVLHSGDPAGNDLVLRGQGHGPLRGSGEPPTEYDFASSTACLYIVAWSDNGAVQGLLHNLRVNDTPVWFNDSRWEVYPTGMDRDDYLTAPPPDIEELSNHISSANASGGWKDVTLGGQNDGFSFPPPCWGCCWVPIPGIDLEAWWGWYDSGNGPTNECQPFALGFNHDEYLIFRLCVDQTIPTKRKTWGLIKELYRSGVKQ